MNADKVGSPPDRWSQWLLNRRYGGDPEFEKIVLVGVDAIRDRVLDQANLAPGQTLVDVGAGDGLIAFGAFDRVGPSLTAIFADISLPLLEHAQQDAVKRGLTDRCTFLHTSAEDLDGIEDRIADIVTCRAVLAYVPDKMKALRQFHRVLKPGGRISIAEPITRDEAMNLLALTRFLEKQPLSHTTAAGRLLQRWRAAQLPSTLEGIQSDPFTNFSERDLVNFCRTVGFQDIHMELHIDENPMPIRSLETFMNIAPHPNARTLNEILTSDFDAEEQVRLKAILKSSLESNSLFERDVVAYLTAVKPT